MFFLRLYAILKLLYCTDTVLIILQFSKDFFPLTKVFVRRTFMDTFTFILEIIGTIAFASSGAMIAIEKKWIFLA